MTLPWGVSNWLAAYAVHVYTTLLAGIDTLA